MSQCAPLSGTSQRLAYAAMLRPRARLTSLALVCTLSTGGCYFYARDTTGDPDGVFAAREYAYGGPKEFRTKGVPGSPHAKPVLGLRNEGRVPHELRAVWVGDLSTGDRRKLRTDLRDGVAVPEELVRSGGVGAVAPGMEAASTQLLSAGRYLLICMLTAPDGRTHAQLGMVTEVKVN